MSCDQMVVPLWYQAIQFKVVPNVHEEGEGEPGRILVANRTLTEHFSHGECNGNKSLDTAPEEGECANVRRKVSTGAPEITKCGRDYRIVVFFRKHLLRSKKKKHVSDAKPCII